MRRFLNLPACVGLSLFGIWSLDANAVTMTCGTFELGDALACEVGNTNNDPYPQPVSAFNLSWEGIDKDEQPDLTTGTDGDTGNPEGWFWWTADGTGEPTSGDWFLDPEVWNLYDRLVIVLKAGPGFSGFELESDDLTGTWNLLEAALSHASLYGVRADTPPPPNGVPEPGTLALLGLGLAGMGALRRRRA